MNDRIRRGVLLSIPGTAIPGIASYLGFVAIQRLDSIATLGYVSLCWVLANVGSAVLALGPAHTALRLIGTEQSNAEEIRGRFRTIVVVRTAWVSSALGLAAVAMAPLSSQGAAVIGGAAIWTVGQALVLFEAETLKASHRFAAASALLASRAVLAWLAATAGAAILGGTLGVIAPAAIVGLLVALPTTRGQLTRPNAADREAARSVGRPLSQFAAVSYMLGYGDRFVIQAVLGPSAVAVYTLGYQLAEGALELILGPVNSATLPAVVRDSQADDQSRASARSLVIRISAGAVGLAILAPTVVLVGASLGLFDLILRDERLPIVAAIVAAAAALQGITRITYGILLAQGRTRRALANYLVAGALGIGGCVLFAVQWGVIGAAWATLLGYGALAVISLISVRER